MPPSPSLRCSPGRELRGDNHKRGRSLEGRTLSRERDDDLTLFNEMDTKEKDGFLLQSDDDFEDILSSKFRYFSSNKIGVSIHARGESSDLLNVEGEKNDYDWLLTPPDTPLFRSLDDETPGITLAPRGRPLSKPMTISRSSTMEKSHVSSRGSASPNRLSISPRSANSTVLSNGRPSSAPRSSPTPSLRGTTPPRRPSPPPKKPSSPVPRSSTPPSRRLNTSSYGKRGASPINKTRGNSASPKAKAWQTNIPGFPSEAPPNLRTSLGDRPASYVRGSSPASRNGRQSMSPTASRSASSSCSHDRDLFSSHSKGSIASSGDDDVDSLKSVPRNSSDPSVIRKGGAYVSDHSPSLSRKSTRPGLSSSAPKRSFESALRQMDHQRKGPQNMFRPLLSSVPSSTFYVGKSTSAHHSLISRNSSSITTSSNTSFDPSPVGAHDAEESDHSQHDIASTYVNEVEDDIFILEKTDSIGEDVSPLAINGGARISLLVGGSQNIDPLSSPSVTTATPEILDTKSKYLEVNNSVENRGVCSECGRNYLPIEFTEGELNLCPDCRRSDGLLSTPNPVPAVIVPEVSRNPSMKILDEYIAFDAVEPSRSLPGSSGLADVSVLTAFQCDENTDESRIVSSDRSLDLSTNNSGGQNVTAQPITGHNSSSDSYSKIQNIQRPSEIPKLKLDISEGTGMSILLKRSSSAKGPFLQSRSFTATSISCDDLSYARDFATSMRSSSSSLDINMKHHRSGSSFSGISSHTLRGSGSNNNEIVVNDESEDGITNAPPKEHSLVSECARFDDECTEVIFNDHVETVKANTINATDSAESSALSFSNIEDSGLYENGEDFPNETQSILDGEDGLASCGSDVVEIPSHCQLETISEIEIGNGHPGSPKSQSEAGSSDSSDRLDELQEPCVSTRSDKDVGALVAECEFLDHPQDNHEESTITVDLGSKMKSLTLEEATDAILFCSSIVQNLAYKAATIAIENENGNENSVPLEGSRPSVTILGNSNSDSSKEPCGRTIAKRTPKSHKTRKRRSMDTNTETQIKALSGIDGTNENSTTRIVGIPDRGNCTNPPKLESKCNCTIM